MNSLINGNSRSSRSIVQIARELQTTPAYLAGETDDPDENAPPPRLGPVVHHVMMAVALPSENALADMFEGLLLSIDRERPVDAQARELAQLLPTGLSQLKGQLRDLPAPPRPASPVPVEALATVDQEPRR